MKTWVFWIKSQEGTNILEPNPLHFCLQRFSSTLFDRHGVTFLDFVDAQDSPPLSVFSWIVETVPPFGQLLVGMSYFLDPPGL